PHRHGVIPRYPRTRASSYAFFGRTTATITPAVRRPPGSDHHTVSGRPNSTVAGSAPAPSQRSPGPHPVPAPGSSGSEHAHAGRADRGAQRHVAAGVDDLALGVGLPGRLARLELHGV